MLTKQPDYTISELGCPQLQLLCRDGFYKKCPAIAPRFPTICRRQHNHSSSSANRLLPLRETLEDYNKRLLIEQAQTWGTGRRSAGLDDAVAQQKRQKNLRNEQQQQPKQQRNRSNQKCRDNKTQAACTTTKATLLNCDLNSF